MLLQQTIQSLRDLKLNPMAKAVEDQCSNTGMLSLSFEERLGLLVEAEVHARDNNRQARRFQQAKLKINACPEDIDYRASRGLDRQVMAHLFTCQFIDNSLNVIITGPTGVGKTWLSCALGQAAIRKGYTVYSIRLSRLFEEFQIARGDGTLRKFRAKLTKANLLIVDDWALSPIYTLERHELLELVDDRMEAGSILITSQLPVDQWHEYLGDPTVADAILDRIVQRAHRIELRGESLRKTDVSLPTSSGVK